MKIGDRVWLNNDSNLPGVISGFCQFMKEDGEWTTGHVVTLDKGRFSKDDALFVRQVVAVHLARPAE